jgi:hypothetical protein
MFVKERWLSGLELISKIVHMALMVIFGCAARIPP